MLPPETISINKTKSEEQSPENGLECFFRLRLVLARFLNALDKGSIETNSFTRRKGGKGTSFYWPGYPFIPLSLPLN